MTREATCQEASQAPRKRPKRCPKGRCQLAPKQLVALPTASSNTPILHNWGLNCFISLWFCRGIFRDHLIQPHYWGRDPSNVILACMYVQTCGCLPLREPRASSLPRHGSSTRCEPRVPSWPLAPPPAANKPPHGSRLAFKFPSWYLFLQDLHKGKHKFLYTHIYMHVHMCNCMCEKRCTHT